MLGYGVAAALISMLPACRSEPVSLLDQRFRLVRTIEVTPIEPFARLPASVVLLPDGRLLLPEAEGVWIHVLTPDGQGQTRLGGQAPELPDGALPPGKFMSLSDVALLPDGRVLAADRTSASVTVYGADLGPRGTITVPRARRVFQIAPLPDGRLAAAVAPRNLVTGGEVVVFAPGDSGSAFLPPNPVFRHNRWMAASSPRIHVTADGRILTYWAAFPWARVLTAAGDSLRPVGRLSALYRGPRSGPQPKAPLESIQRWYDSFTPLVLVEAADAMLVFEYRAATSPSGTRSPSSNTGPTVARAAPATTPGQMFLNLYDGGGRPVATDLLLPPGTHLLRSNDAKRLYLLRSGTARGLQMEVWEPREATSSR